MFGIGHLPELILILVLALIFVGPGKLPSVGAALGKSIAQFKKATNDVEEDLRSSIQSSSAPREVRREQHYLSADGRDQGEAVSTAETRDRSIPQG